MKIIFLLLEGQNGVLKLCFRVFTQPKFKHNFKREFLCKVLSCEVHKLSVMSVKITLCFIQTEFTSRRENLKLQSSVL